jgi:hypothetical protein
MNGTYEIPLPVLLVSEFSYQSLLVGVCCRGIVIVEASNVLAEVRFKGHWDLG